MKDIYNWNSVLEEAQKIVVDTPDINKTDLAERLQIPRKTFTEAMQREWRVSNVSEILGVNVLKYQYHQEVFKLAGSYVVAHDFEIPFQNSAMIEKLISVAKIFGIDKIVIAGDFLSMDSVSKWPKSGENRVELKDELNTAKRVLTRLASQFNTFYFLKGNHEDRIVKITDGAMNMRMILDMIKPENAEIYTSEFYWCDVNSDWRVGHPDSYSSSPRAVMNKIAAKHHKNVIGGHQHFLSYSFDVSGQYQLVDGGHMTIQSARYYKDSKFDGSPNWNAGFSVLRQVNKKTYLHLFSEDGTDWDFWLGQPKKTDTF